MRKELKNARKDMGLTVAEVCNMVDISPSFYYKIESGKRNPTIALAAKIAKVLEKRVEQLFFDEAADDEPEEHENKEHIRCTASFCFDMQDICCKSCSFKKCTYKCDHIDEDECKYQKK